MEWITSALAVTAGVMAFLFWVVLVYSAMENEWRAFWVTLAVAVPVVGLYFILWLVDFPGREGIGAAAVALPALGLLILLLPLGERPSLKIKGPQERVDERDAVFHRFYRLRPGSPEFEAFYKAHPEKRDFDEKVRELPPLAEPGAKTYDPITSPFQVAAFLTIEEMSREIERAPSPLGGEPVQASPEEFAKRIKGFAKYLGAKKTGCTKLNPAYVYSHIGRSPGEWGAPIDLDHKNAIVFAVEMDHDMVRQAPDAHTTTETAYKYLEAGKIAMTVARYIHFLGYEARAHVDGNYRVMCVPLAQDAGLGELGRLGLLITPEMGPRIRLSVVTTDLPLAQDQPIHFGVQHFCDFCRKCADLCPSASLDKGDKQIHNGVEKWRSEQDTCYRAWRLAGSDCNLCVKVCPYSHPGNLMHDGVRFLINRNALARRLALWGDDLLYGRRPRAVYPTPRWHWPYLSV
jgi:ferredoxin